MRKNSVIIAKYNEKEPGVLLKKFKNRRVRLAKLPPRSQ